MYDFSQYRIAPMSQVVDFLCVDPRSNALSQPSGVILRSYIDYSGIVINPVRNERSTKLVNAVNS